MNRPLTQTTRYPFEIRSGVVNTLFFTTLVIIMTLTVPGQAEPDYIAPDKRILIEEVIPDATGGFGYRLEYLAALGNK